LLPSPPPPLDSDLYKFVADNCPDAVFVLDPEDPAVPLRIVFANAAAVATYGYTAQEMIGQSIVALLDTPGSAADAATSARAIMAGEPVVFEAVHRDRGGREFPIEVHAKLGTFAGRRLVLGLSHDITARKQLEAQLRQSQKLEAIGRLSGGIAHDFNNILTVILGNAELGREEARASGGQLGELLDEIHQAAARAAGLTRQLLAFSRKQTLTLRPIKLDQVITGLDSMLRRLLGEDLALVVELGDDLRPIKADASQLEQVIVNLAVNARDAMASGGTLTISAHNVKLGPGSAELPAEAPPGEYVVVSIRDTGVGMPPEVQAQIFEPFFTTRKPGEGTGLGLATVFGIIKQSGGYVAVDSAVGQGSTFSLYFPPTELPRLEHALLSPEPQPARARETVLLAEDEELVRKMAKRVCESAGYQVIVAPDGVEALRLAAAYPEPIHVLITDVVMPRLGGRELAEQLTRQRPGLPVLYMSGYTQDVVIDHGVAHQGLAFLQKPFTQAALLYKLRELLGEGTRAV
jgi:PAS domain S-box-containing protein